MSLFRGSWLVPVLLLLILSLGSTACGDSGTTASILLAAEFPAGTTEQEKATLADAAILTISSRLIAYGIADPSVERQGSDNILVEIADVSNIETVVDLIEKTGSLEFREVEARNGTAVTLADYLGSSPTDFFDPSVTGTRIFAFPAELGESQPSSAVLVKGDDGSLAWVDVAGNPIDPEALEVELREAYSWMPAVGESGEPLTGAYLTKVEPQFDQSANIPRYVVAIEWNSEGAVIFDDVARRLYGRTDPLYLLGMFLDSELISSPRVVQTEFGGMAVIEGDFTEAEAKLLAIRLNSGALPVPLHVVSATTN